VGVLVRQHLPVHPRHTCRRDLSRPVLDVGVPGGRRKDSASRAVVVLGVKVTCTPGRHMSKSGSR
jgi:hypothetical protein